MADQSKRGRDTGLNDLPEGCIANVISLTSPKDACRLSLVDSRFRTAADSDQVWERFLPTDYREILSQSTEGTTLLRCNILKRQLYFHMCRNPHLIDGRSKCLWLDKPTGKKSFVLGARALSIGWIDDPGHWKFISWQGSRFGSAAEQVKPAIWLHIGCTIDASILSAGTTYGVYLVFRMGKASYGDGPLPAKAMIGFVGREKQWSHWSKPREVNVHPNGAVNRGDGWLEVQLGLVMFIDGKEDANVGILVQQVIGGCWTRGYLVIEGIEIRVA